MPCPPAQEQDFTPSAACLATGCPLAGLDTISPLLLPNAVARIPVLMSVRQRRTTERRDPDVIPAAAIQLRQARQQLVLELKEWNIVVDLLRRSAQGTRVSSAAGQTGVVAPSVQGAAAAQASLGGTKKKKTHRGGKKRKLAQADTGESITIKPQTTNHFVTLASDI